MSAVQFLAYQRAWLADTSRRRILLKARRIGGSFTAEYEAACDGIGFTLGLDGSGPRFDPALVASTLVLSTGERKAADFLAGVVKHVKALELAAGRPFIERVSEERIKLNTGAHVLALPGGNPDAVHGFAGNVVLDEAARLPNARELFKAAAPVAGATLARAKGYRVSIISTPNGGSGLFYDLCQGDLVGWGSLHTVDIHRAVADGFPTTVEEALADVAGDRELFREQYEADFGASEGAYFSGDLLDAAMIDRDDMPPVPRQRSVRTAGYDVARKRDLVSVVEGFSLGGILYLSACESRRDVRWAEQEAWAADVLARCGRMGVDETGIGSQFAERLQHAHGGAITRVHFGSAPTRESLWGGFKRRLATGTVRIASDLPDVRRALASVRREVTDGGAIRYVLPRRAGGHADEAVAAALCAFVSPDPDAGDGPVYRSIIKRPVIWNDPRSWATGARDGETGPESLARRYGAGRGQGWGRHY